eukprot:11199954-Ditylum_brightwellii.AAC.1
MAVARDVMDFFDECGYIIVDQENKKNVNAVLRQGKKKGMQHYKLREENVWKSDEYVYVMTAVNQDPMIWAVYMDESYIHINYHRHDDSLFDPNDEQDLKVKAMHKGRQFCFIAAIIDKDKTLSHVPEEKSESAKAHLMLDTLDIFEGREQTVDYHG